MNFIYNGLRVCICYGRLGFRGGIFRIFIFVEKVKGFRKLSCLCGNYDIMGRG